MQRTQRITEQAGTKTVRTILRGIDSLHTLEPAEQDKVEQQITDTIIKYIRDAYVVAWITEATELERRYGPLLAAPFLLRLADIKKNGPDQELIETAEKYVINIKYTTKTDFRMVDKAKQIIKIVPGKEHDLKGIIHRNFTMYKKHMADIKQAKLDQHNEEMLKGWRTGEHGESGLGYRLSNIVRTEGDTVQATASTDTYKEAGVNKYIYCSMLDDKTCTKCRELDGKVFKLSQKKPGVNFPIIHNGCRCYTEPYMD